MTDDQLTAIFEQIHSQYFSKKSKDIQARFHPYRSLRHTIEWNHKYTIIKVSQYLKNAPLNILEDLAIILYSKIYKVKPDRKIRESYNNYAAKISEDLPKRKKAIPKGYSPQGKYFNLETIFGKLNSLYFSNELSVKYLGWSKNRSFTRLGYFDKERDLLVISQIFDSRKVPLNVLEYLVYHEMLHIFIPTTKKNERRIIHSKAFKEQEKKFPEYSYIQNWIKKKRFKL